MATATFTTRIDADLKARLEQIAKFEDRSASYMANQAIAALVEEREATQELVATALELVAMDGGHDEAVVEAWLDAPADTAFPKATARS
jgi:predicted transcriptional regulator